jgi:DNA-binding response OmpR family regulator
MKVLIVESQAELGVLWQRHLERQGAEVTLAHSQSEAVQAIQDGAFEVMVLDLVLEHGSAFAVSDFASFWQPEVRVIFVTNTTFFSDGSIFAHSRNACAYMPSSTPASDLAAMVEHYAVH